MERPPLLLDIPDVIETDRLILRVPRLGDGPAMNEAIVETWETLHHAMPWARTRATVEETEALARQFRANFIARADLPMFMFLKDGKMVVGSSGLHRMDWSVPRFEIGYWVRRSFEGKGYATEAVRALTRFAFGTLEAARVEIRCSHRNERSQRVAQKCGYLLEGRLRNESREPTGELRDTLVYARIPGDPGVESDGEAPLRVDFGKTASDYAKHRVGFPDTFFERLSSVGVGKPEQRVLDLGTGTGSVARGLARRGCSVTGLDKSLALLEEAKRLDQAAGVSVRYLAGSAESAPFSDCSFDVVTAGQCWHWFERPRVAKEVRRLLAPGGTLVIAHFDWIPVPGNVVERTETLIRKHNPAWNLGSAPSGGAGLYPAWLEDVVSAGLRGIETFSFDVEVPYTHEAWRGRIRASAGVGASLSPERIARFDVELQQVLETHFPETTISVPHRLWAVIGRAP